jgi:Ca2+-binding RTX toxin-like protein
MTYFNDNSGVDYYNHLGSDSLYASGYEGNDFIWGNTANDIIYGDQGSDTLKGYDGNDYLNGGSGNDSLEGEYGDDSLLGGDDNDTLLGGYGNDTLYGDSGNDYLNGFGGGYSVEIDTLTGGSGSDTFAIGDSTGVAYLGGYDYLTNTDGSYALITDFSAADDFIQAYAGASYSLGYGYWSGGSALDTGIYTGGDLLAVVQDTTNVDFGRDFLFV